MTSSSPPIINVNVNNLPKDCLGNIFSFLPLHEILQYATTSKASMQRCIAEINQRKRKLFISFHWSGNKIVSLGYNGQGDDTERHSVHSMHSIHSIHSTVKLPSIHQRIQSLYQNVSSSHPMHDSIYQLVQLLQTDISPKDDIQGKERLCNDAGDHFNTMFHTMKHSLQFYKLHTQILTSTIYPDIVTITTSNQNQSHTSKSAITSTSTRIHNNGRALDLNLDHYLGDVYITFVLMGNISSGLVDGISEQKWLKTIENKTATKKEDTMATLMTNYDALTWYQCWVFIHSTLLRTIHLSSIERIQLGLAADGNLVTQIVRTSSASTATTTTTNGGQQMMMILPPVPFQGLHKTKTMLHLYKNLYSDGVLIACFRDFGPLGPSFRGR